MNGFKGWNLFGSPDRKKKKEEEPSAKDLADAAKKEQEEAIQQEHELRQKFAVARAVSFEKQAATSTKKAEEAEEEEEKIKSAQDRAHAAAAEVFVKFATEGGLVLDENVRQLPPADRTKKIIELMMGRVQEKQQLKQDLSVAAQGFAAKAQEARNVADMIGAKRPGDDFSEEDKALFSDQTQK